MYPGIFIALFIMLTACHAAPGLPDNGRLSTASNVPWGAGDYDSTHYAFLKATIRAESKAIAKQQSGRKLETARSFLFAAITDSLFSYWYGTPWDYNGITQVPRKGMIACGYFVTTILRDAGLPIARVKMAQAPSSDLIKAACLPGTIKRFGAYEAVTAYIDAKPAGSLMILGLDNHVGFVMKDSTGSYFVHASYMGAQAVEKQPLAEAGPVRISGSFMIGDLLANEKLLIQWLR